MKPFNISADTRKEIGGQQVPVMALGEPGRGRQLTLIRVPAAVAAQVQLEESKPGMPKRVAIVNSKPESVQMPCAWLARVSTCGAYVRGANGNVRVLVATASKVRVVARGQGAFGDAGRTGTWDDLLLVVEPGTVLRVKPSRSDAYWVHFGEKVTHLTLPELALFDEVDIPDVLDQYVRL